MGRRGEPQARPGGDLISGAMHGVAVASSCVSLARILNPKADEYTEEAWFEEAGEEEEEARNDNACPSSLDD